MFSNMTHIFFTPESADDFRTANQAREIPVGRIKFMPEMPMQFFTEKCQQDKTFSEIPDDIELMRIIREMPTVK